MYSLVMLTRVLMLLFVVSLKVLFWVHCYLIYIYINDITKATSKFNVIMYADDTTLVSILENFGTLNNIAVIEDEINKEITKISHWLHINKLLLNTAKSKFMVFFGHPKTIPKLKLTINDNPIEQVTEFNFLGITIDQNVTWRAHITKDVYKNCQSDWYSA